MADVKVNIYTPAGRHVGYFVNPAVKSHPDGDYELSGEFYDASGEKPVRIDFNPQAMPYTADLADHCNNNATTAHRKLSSVYIQSGRQPVKMSGRGQ
jgi:hypothetical protein